MTDAAAELLGFLRNEAVGSPFTQHFLRSSDPEFLREVATFVGDLLAERLVLAYRSGRFRGGREFVEPDRASGQGAVRYAWVGSWKDGYRGRMEGNPGNDAR